jgi:acetylglutamate kinase
VALGAAKLILMTDVPGVLDGDKRVLSELSRSAAERLIANGQVTGGMIPKLQACLRSLERVPSAHIIDGRTPHSLLLELFTEAGIGTMVTADK